MRALLIDVEEKAIREVELPPSDPVRGQCDAIIKLIGGGCSLFCHVKLSANMSLWVDDEGLLQNRTKGFLPVDRIQPIMGNGLITGMDPNTGDIVPLDPECTASRMAGLFMFIDYDNPGDVPVPPVEIVSF